MFKLLTLLIIFGICWVAPQSQEAGRLAATAADISFTISAKNLRGDVDDYDREVDPFVNVYLVTEISTNSTENNRTFERLGTSEILHDNNNPGWNTVFKFKYIPGTNQVIHLFVRDYDPISADDALVHAAIPVDEFITRGIYTTHLSSNSSEITVRQTTPIYFDLTLKGIPLKDNWEGASDLYVMCYCIDRDGNIFLFHITNIVVNAADQVSYKSIPFLNYQWGMSQVIHFKVYDYDTWTPDDLLGYGDLPIDTFIASRRSALLKLGGRATLTVTLSRDF